MRRKEKVIVFFIVFCFLTLSFIQISTSSPLSNHPPFSPTNLQPPYPNQPPDQVPIDTNFSWSGGDPDAGDMVMYYVYLGPHNPPTSLVATVGPYQWNQTQITWNPDFLLNYETKYYWKIVAFDNYNASNESYVQGFWTVREQPMLRIGKIHGGFMNVTSEIQNLNSAAGLNATNVTWNITVKGRGLLRELNYSTNRIIPLLKNNGGTEVVNISDLWGIARITITVQAAISDDPHVTPIKKSTDGFIFGLFVYVKNSDN